MFPTSYARSLWFLEFRVLGVDEIDPMQFSFFFKVNLFLRPLLLLLQLCVLFH